MAEYKCKCNDEVVDKSGVTIKYIEGVGVIHDIRCEKCEEYMELANPKSGAPGFRSNRFGQTFALALAASMLFMSCSPQHHYRLKQSKKYNQCWCIDPWAGGAEWCCDGDAPKYMAPYKHKKGFIKAKF